MPKKKKSTAAKNRKAKSGENKVDIVIVGKKNKQAAAVILFAIAILLLSLLIMEGSSVWKSAHNLLYGLLGLSAYLLPAILFYISINVALDKPIGKISTKIWQGLVLVTLLSVLVHLFTTSDADMTDYFKKVSQYYRDGVLFKGGGAVGAALGIPFMSVASVGGSRVIICLLVFVFLMLVTGTTLLQLFNTIKKPVKRLNGKKEMPKVTRKAPRFNIDVPLDDDIPVQEKPEIRSSAFERFERAIKDESEPAKLDDIVERAAGTQAVKLEEKAAEIDGEQQYVLPPLSLLDMPKRLNESNVSDELKNNAAKLIDTLRSFGVQAKIIDISRGPAVTRYELKPAPGVKISKITNLSDDIALNLASAGVRIEAPIPGKAAIGIEVPNKNVSIVSMREMVDTTAFKRAKSKLTVVLGKDIGGNVTLADIAKMPHLLIAGATGSGKSVCINSIILSILYKASPHEVKFFMIDPKVVELGVYNGIAHLLVPVVNDPRKAVGVLRSAVNEMLNRYKMFAENNVRDLKGYNSLAEKKGYKKLPQIVIVIDELADLMMIAPNDVEDNICRLAQMARAAGMHLIVATQRPSVDVITGIIKANIPSRIAFSVTSQVDSRVILDMAGAEKLLGRGDMLFLPVGASKPIRIQGCFVNEREVEAVVNYIKNSCSSDYDEEFIKDIDKQSVITKGKGDNGADETDEMLPKAIECVVEAGEASTSQLQRRLRLGYARAGRLIDEMERRGIVGPHEGSKPRKVLITKAQWLEMNMQNEQ